MNRRRTRAAALTAVAVTATWALTGCAGTAPAESAPRSVSASAAPANRADIQFTQMMVVHHEGAVDMAQLAADRAGRQEVKDLALRIERAQQPEIETMQGWLEAWGERPLDDDGAMPGMHHGGMATDGMGGMASADDMTDLRDATGDRFDRLFLRLMISHHEGAVVMARIEVDRGENPDVIAFAAAVVSDQTAEIDEMRNLLAAYDGG